MDQDFIQYCNETVLYEPDTISTKYQHWLLIPAVFIIVGLSFLEKRKNIKTGCFGGRPAPARPFSFLDETRNRWGILFVFGTITGTVIRVVLKTFQGNFPIWGKIFRIYLLSLEACVICYPLFACMTTRHKLLGGVLGLMYSFGWFGFEMFATVQEIRCAAAVYAKEFNSAVHLIIQVLPVKLCNLLLVVKFCHMLFKCIKHKNYKMKKEIILCTTFHITYVKHMLMRPAQQIETDATLKERIKTNVIAWIPGFRFPITVMSAVFMSSVMLYMVGLFCAEAGMIIAEIVATLESGKGSYKNLVTAANVIACLFTFVCGIRNICVFMKNYRSNMISLYRGDRSFVPDTLKEKSANVYMAQGMRFLGTSIVGTFWGTVFCYLLIFVPLTLMMIVFRLLKQTGNLGKLFIQFEWAIYPACMIIIFQIQTFLIGRFLIQPKIKNRDKQRPLAVDNRAMYDILSFFLVFLNASLGLFTFMKRILVGAFLGVFLIPRMDRSLLIRGYEAMDKCYVNYVGMIMVDLAHNHPVMRVFCHVIKECAEVKWFSREMANTAENPEYSTVAAFRTTPVRCGNSIAMRRWLLAYTLINNPSLVRERRTGLKRSEVDVNDIEYSESGEDLFQEGAEESCLIQRWRRFKRCQCKFPRNLSTNLIALIVLLSFAILFAGVPILIKEL